MLKGKGVGKGKGGWMNCVNGRLDWIGFDWVGLD